MEAIHNGACQRHPLLLTPATTVSVTHAISSGKQPRSRTELVAYQSPFPSSSALEGPVHQADFFSPSLVASRLLGARPTSSLLTGLEGPRHPANQAVMTPWQNMGEAGGGGRGERGEGGKGGRGVPGLGWGLLGLGAGPTGTMWKLGLAASRARLLLTSVFAGIGREGCQSPSLR